MKASSGAVRFRLPIPWDIAVTVLKHTAHNGRVPFQIHRHGNGYLRLRLSRALRPSITININILAELDRATTVMAADVTKGIWISNSSRRQIDALLDQFRSDAEFFATRLHQLDTSVTSVTIGRASESKGSITRNRATSPIGKRAAISPSS